MGFLEKGAWLLFVIFFALKVGGVGDVADWSWWAVLSPILINYSIAVFAIGLVWIASWRVDRRNRSWIDRL